jgi:uncharacterized cupin superfamily protein
VNLAAAELETHAMPEPFAGRGASVSRDLGAELVGCSLYDIAPGEQLWPYHYHRNNEEWLIVVAGSPTLRTPAGETLLEAGDLVAFPEGEDGAHTLLNRGAGASRVAIFSTKQKGSTVYPDSGKVGVAGSCFRVADAVDYWDGETGPR